VHQYDTGHVKRSFRAHEGVLTFVVDSVSARRREGIDEVL
jgi:hypothetical protein